ncbi:FecR family protein [Bacteroides sp. 51]|uniref:FecR family protein n=1 Tax=Bacteroides sp. 51 TaxID=2302938 RepID=UPI0013D8546B|nr:FecR domain-containing protein [Bacteroides sp. 51]NDV84307.1 FecR family protein [Bacteroides sp. 51]
MDQKELDLINKSFTSELSESEQKELRQWREEKGNDHLYKLIEDIQLDESIECEAENMRFSILDDIHRRIDASKRRISHFKTISIAASLALLIGFSGFFLYQNNFNRVNQIITMSNPSGTKSEITLPDGSTVILHGSSTISYPTAFSNKARKVELTGEAYFDIRKNEQVPFMVHSGKINVKVLGTTFNVEAYDEDDYICVTLATGKVSLSVKDYEGELILAPDQQAVYNKQTQEILKRNINAEEVVGWTNNQLYFNSMPLDDIVRKLERHFNVEIEISVEKLKNIRYTGEFVEDESIDEILTMFSMMDNRVKYERKNNKIIIYE